MMKAIKGMLSVLMDGVKDTDMMLDYAHDAMHNEHDEQAAKWFRTKADGRFADLKRDRTEVFQATGICQKAESGDAIACAFMEHVDSEIERIRRRIESAGK